MGTCMSCKHWVQKPGQTVEIGKPTAGVCKRFPPQVAGLIQNRHPITGEPFLMPVFAEPDTLSTHECGEYSLQLAENS